MTCSQDPIEKKVPNEPLRLELTRASGCASLPFNDEAAFRRYLDAKRKLGPVGESDTSQRRAASAESCEATGMPRSRRSCASENCASSRSLRWKPAFENDLRLARRASRRNVPHLEAIDHDLAAVWEVMSTRDPEYVALRRGDVISQTEAGGRARPGEPRSRGGDDHRPVAVIRFRTSTAKACMPSSSNGCVPTRA